MQLDIIYLDKGLCLFRAAGDHAFSAGQGDVRRVETIAAKPPYCPQPHEQPLVKNLCGKFLAYLGECEEHAPVAKKPRACYFGRHRLMHHLHGTVSVYRGVAFFKGCCGHGSLLALSRDLFLEDPGCVVHMGVFKTFLGRHIQTCHGCYLEHVVGECLPWLRVAGRTDEECQAVKLRLDDAASCDLPHLSGCLVPTSLDVTVTNTGVVLMRFSWARCSWTPEAEALALRFCSWLASELRRCC
jgi:hypothetical protein